MSTQAEAKTASPAAPAEMPVVPRCVRCRSEFIVPRLLLFGDGSIKLDLGNLCTYWCPGCQHEFRVRRDELLAHARRLDPREMEGA